MATDKRTVLDYLSYDLSHVIYSTTARPLVDGWVTQRQNNSFGAVGKFAHLESVTKIPSLISKEAPGNFVTILAKADEVADILVSAGSIHAKLVIHASVEKNQLPLGQISLAKSIGATILVSGTIAEVQANGLLSYLASANSPVIHYFHLIDGESPLPVQHVDHSVIANLLHNKDSLSNNLATLSAHGIAVKPVEYFGPVSETVIVSYGSYFNRNDIVAALQAKHVGLLHLSTLSPIDESLFLQTLPKSVKKVELAIPSTTSSQFLEILSLFRQHPSSPEIVLLPSDSGFKALIPQLNVVAEDILDFNDQTVETILASVFQGNYQLFHAKGSSEVSFGATLSSLQRKQVFGAALLDILHSSQSSPSLKAFAKAWLNDEPYLDSSISKELEILVKTSSFESYAGILNDSSLVHPKSTWMVDDGYLLDLGNNLIHTILTSGENINVLIIDRSPYFDVEDQEFLNRRDAALYAMNYGGAYVASICPSYSYSQAAQAIREANSFKGPSIVILLSPKSKVPRSSALQQVSTCKKIIDAGLYSLYRWNPSANESNAKFQVDSSKPKANLEKFLEKEANLSLVLESVKIGESETLEGNLEKVVVQKAEESYKALFGNIEKKRLLILFGSDGGNAESLAKRLGMEAKEKGLYVKVMAGDNYVIEDLAKEEFVLFVVSTAGQGEFPGNIRETWKALSSNEFEFSNVNYSVFAMGDRHYWPRPEDAHYFAKSGKDLYHRMEKLGAKQLTPIGIGDDRDPDGYFTGYAAWVPHFWTSLGVDADEVSSGPAPPTDDAIKIASNYLRGTIAEGLVDTSTGALAELDTKLTKFHGIYQQDDRDIREHRARKGLEKAFSFMIRVRVPGGITTPEQYLAMDEISDKWANSTIKITTRQAFQFHGVVKSVLKRTIQDINKSLLGKRRKILTILDTIAACGDVNRNVMCNPNPGDNVSVHKAVLQLSRDLSAHLTPATSAYHEIWLDKKLVAGGEDHEPLYGKTYLPRKFKIAIAVPPSNDVDCLAHDLGYIAIVENDQVIGYNVTVGGGMGQTHGNKKTYPLLAKALGFCTPQQAVEVGEKVMLVQRDYGERVNRKHARLKYTIEDRGIDWFRGEVETRLGYKLQPSKPYKFTSNGDRYGWSKSNDGTWNFTLFIQNGRIKDTPEYKLKTGLREIAKIHKGEFALSPNQHLLIMKIKDQDKGRISELLAKYSIDNNGLSGMRLNSMACVALPTCALAMAESERYLPSLVSKIEDILEQNGLRDDAITIRMTGCPNGCARPAIAEIAFIGKAPGMYNMYLGGGFAGERLNRLFKESIGEEEILTSLEPLIRGYSLERLQGEHFGDYIIRKGVV